MVVFSFKPNSNFPIPQTRFLHGTAATPPHATGPPSHAMVPAPSPLSTCQTFNSPAPSLPPRSAASPPYPLSLFPTTTSTPPSPPLRSPPAPPSATSTSHKISSPASSPPRSPATSPPSSTSTSPPTTSPARFRRALVSSGDSSLFPSSATSSTEPYLLHSVAFQPSKRFTLLTTLSSMRVLSLLRSGTSRISRSFGFRGVTLWVPFRILWGS